MKHGGRCLVSISLPGSPGRWMPFSMCLAQGAGARFHHIVFGVGKLWPWAVPSLLPFADLCLMSFCRKGFSWKRASEEPVKSG